MGREAIVGSRFVGIDASHLQRRHLAVFDLSQCGCKQPNEVLDIELDSAWIVVDANSQGYRTERCDHGNVSLETDGWEYEVCRVRCFSSFLYLCSFLPRVCSLTGDLCACDYRIRVGETGEWYPLSRLSRNRVNPFFACLHDSLLSSSWQIVSVCDFFTFIRHVQSGLVKSDSELIETRSSSRLHSSFVARSRYNKIIELRKQMAFARLGLWNIRTSRCRNACYRSTLCIYFSFSWYYLNCTFHVCYSLYFRNQWLLASLARRSQGVSLSSSIRLFLFFFVRISFRSVHSVLLALLVGQVSRFHPCIFPITSAEKEEKQSSITTQKADSLDKINWARLGWSRGLGIERLRIIRKEKDN